MFLHELSDDVLRLIISELDTDTGKNDLISLALTCRRLSQFARHAITRNVKLIMPSRQFELFVRSLAENPTYGDGVLWLWKITSNAPPWAPLRPEFRHLLCKLPNLRILGMTRSLDTLGDKLFSCHLPLQNTLRHLPIEERLPIAWELLSLPYLYLIRSLGIFDENEIQFDDENLPFTPRDLRAAPKPLLDFRSFTNAYISPSALQAVLFSCSGYLEALFTTIPAEQQWLESSSQQRRRFRILRPFSAALLTPVFAPLSRTLTDLVIKQGFQE
jgi:hypothetical protein